MVALSQLHPGGSCSSDLASGHHLPRSISEGSFSLFLCCLLTARLGLGKFSQTFEEGASIHGPRCHPATGKARRSRVRLQGSCDKPGDFLLPTVLYLWVLEAAEGASSRSWEGLACSWASSLLACPCSQLPPDPIAPHSTLIFIAPPILHAGDFWIFPWEGMSPN